MKPSRFLKRLIQSDAAHSVACWLIAQYLRLVYYTSRWEYFGFEKQEDYDKETRPFIVLMWHNRIALTAFAWDCKNRPIFVLSSGHRDGKLVSGSLAKFGVGCVEGSSSQSPVAATKAVVRLMKTGKNAALSPDGPRGPRMRMKDGPVIIRKLTNARLTFATYSVKNRIVLNSWDNFVLPLPFNKGVFYWGDEEDLPELQSEKDTAKIATILEDYLNLLTEKADRHMGHEPIQPAPEGTLPKAKATGSS